MRLLERDDTGGIRLTEDFPNDKIPPYAILSHTWGAEEVLFRDMTDDTGKSKAGYAKIRFCGDQAGRDGLKFFWVDTCCIDKSNSTELQEAINSMFRWYHNAAKCYAYLADVSTLSLDVGDESIWVPAFRASRWFTRGWTLQELIAPISVEFFSRENVRLGDRKSLEQHIHDVTGIPLRALHSSPLSEFSVPDRMAWVEKRNTTREEDKAYSLFGIFDVQLPLLYGEGEQKAFRRLREEIRKASSREQTYDQSEDRCLADLRSTDPRHDKIRIEDAKGGLLRDSYRWVLDNAEFQRWRDDENSRLLWIKGDPGKGKTMLVCGIIDELKTLSPSCLLSFFLCQATDSRINNATAVLRGMIYLLVSQEPTLISYVRTKYDHAGKTLFEDANAWVALSEVFTNILQDPCLGTAYLIIDALDECVTDLSRLLRLIVKNSTISPRIKWIVSSRNWPEIEEQLETATYKARLSLELNAESIATAVDTYIRNKVDQLAQLKNYDTGTKDMVRDYLHSHANDTFLWVALVCQELATTPGWKVKKKLALFPPGLDALYRRMMDQICKSEDAALCKDILAVVSVVYRPITLDELTALVDTLDDVFDNHEALAEIVGLCGSFLTLRERTISFVHQSAKDFLLKQARDEIFPAGIEEVHRTIFSRSLRVMRETLRRDIYNLGAPGFPIDKVRPPNPDPLAAVRYSCVYWIDHLRDCDPKKNANKDIQNGGSIDTFLCEKYLHWLEALSLQKSISEGVASMLCLEGLLEVGKDTSLLIDRVRDAYRFILYHKWAVENSPLQVYASALVFSPARSITRSQFENDEPKWIIRNPTIADNWGACLQTLEGHRDRVYSVAWSPDASRLASASDDETVKIWDPTTGQCVATLGGHSDSVYSVAWSPDASRLASASGDDTVKIWDPATGQCVATLEGHRGPVMSIAWSPDASRLASASYDETV
ncbi:uncharacterized protein B0T15DRAFT_554966, partial [Chaetomium strumarium]